jgi:hypothetical protein
VPGPGFSGAGHLHVSGLCLRRAGVVLLAGRRYVRQVRLGPAGQRADLARGLRAERGEGAAGLPAGTSGDLARLIGRPTTPLRETVATALKG